jgi:hypothetical protein
MKRIFLLFIFTAFSSALSLTAQTETQQTAPKAEDLTAFVGSYKFTEYFSKGVVEVKDGELYAEIDAYGKNKLIKQPEADTFKSTSTYGTVFKFKRNAEGKVNGVTLQLMGQELTGEKE